LTLRFAAAIACLIAVGVGQKAGPLGPAPVRPSDITVLVEHVGRTPKGRNHTSPVVVGSDLVLIDQGTWIYRWNGGTPQPILTAADAPPCVRYFDGEAFLNVAPSADGRTLYVVFTSDELPAGVPKYDSPRQTNSWQVICGFDFDGAHLSKGRPIIAFHMNAWGHTGGGFVVLPDGSLLFATGDNGDSGEDGRNFAQDPAALVGKLLRIDPATGALVIAGIGVRNPQRLVVYMHDGEARLDFVDIGGSVAEELNSVRVADLPADAKSAPLNFGWGRHPRDRKAREGTFYIDPGGVAVGAAPRPEPGFIQPAAEWGREGRTLVAGSGPVSSTKSFSRITSLVADLADGSVYAILQSPAITGQDVVRVNLVDTANQPVTLKALAGGGRADPRLLNFPDGLAGVLLEPTGDLFRLTERGSRQR